MNIKNIIIIVVFCNFFTQAYAADGEVFANINDDGNIEVTMVITEDICLVESPLWEGEPFMVEYKREGIFSLWDHFKYSNMTPSEIFDIEDFEAGETYIFRISYLGRPRTNSCTFGWIRTHRIGKTKITIPLRKFDEPAVFHPLQDTSKSKVIISNLSGKCLYPYTWDGGSLDTVRLHQWSCFREPPKAFIITELDSDMVKLESQTLGYCIGPKEIDFDGGGEIGIVNCSSMEALYEKVYGIGGFRLRNAVSGLCLIPEGISDGDRIIQTTCIPEELLGQSTLSFYFEDY